MACRLTCLGLTFTRLENSEKCAICSRFTHQKLVRKTVVEKRLSDFLLKEKEQKYLYNYLCSESCVRKALFMCVTAGGARLNSKVKAILNMDNTTRTKEVFLSNLVNSDGKLNSRHSEYVTTAGPFLKVAEGSALASHPFYLEVSGLCKTRIVMMSRESLEELYNGIAVILEKKGIEPSGESK